MKFSMKTILGCATAAMMLVTSVFVVACSPTEGEVNNGPVLTKIEITKDPQFLDYTVGERFDPYGMEVTAFYDNNTKKVVSDYDYSPKEELTETDTVITITYGGKSATLPINISLACLHKNRNWTVAKYPSLGSAGELVGVCPDCENSTTVTLPAVGTDPKWTQSILTPAGGDNVFGSAEWTYNDPAYYLNFTVKTRIDPDGVKTFQYECENMTMIRGAKSSADSANGASGGQYVGWMSGKTQVNRGWSFEINASQAGKAFFIICAAGRSSDIVLNTDHKLLVSYAPETPEDEMTRVTLPDDLAFRAVTNVDLYGWQENDIVAIDLQEGYNKITFLHVTGGLGTNYDYIKLLSTFDITAYTV